MIIGHADDNVNSGLYDYIVKFFIQDRCLEPRRVVFSQWWPPTSDTGLINYRDNRGGKLVVQYLAGGPILNGSMTEFASGS